VPWRHLAVQRDLAVSGSSGAYLVDQAVGEVIMALPPDSLVRQLGITLLPGLRANYSEPRIATDDVGYWLGTEATNITASDPVVGSIAYSPKMAGATFKVSRQFIKQAPNAEQWLRAQLARALDVLLIKAALNGSGLAGEPLGLLGMSGTGAQAGAGLSHANTTNMVRKVRVANAGGSPSLAWLADPATLEVLEGRAKNGTGSGFIAADGRINGAPYHSNTGLPAGTAVVGAWAELVIASWGAGPIVEVTPWASAADFKAGIVACRVMLPVDVAARHPAAFTIATSVN
jgi:HK97 family phage major capsid protein